MTDSFNIVHRRPIWIALSDFYLDTELQDSTFRYIAFTILESPYSLEEVKAINKYELFPVLQANLLNPAGEWAGFEKKWLIDNITLWLKNKNEQADIDLELNYQKYQWMCADYWEKLEKIYDDLQQGITDE